MLSFLFQGVSYLAEYLGLQHSIIHSDGGHVMARGKEEVLAWGIIRRSLSTPERQTMVGHVMSCQG